MDTQQSSYRGLRELALFAGAGGGILGGHLLGWRTVCAVEWEPYPAAVLAARQNESILPPFPIWDDVQTFDGHPWRGLVDVVSGGFPCQDISSAGKGAGITGARSGMWKHMARIIREVEPTYAWLENSPLLTRRGLWAVLGDLASLGYDAEWGVLAASGVGANHRRERIWILAYGPARVRARRKLANPSLMHGNGSNNNAGGCAQLLSEPESGDHRWSSGVANAYGEGPKSGCAESERRAIAGCDSSHVADPYLSQREGGQLPSRGNQEYAYASEPSWWQTEPDMDRVVDGLAVGLDHPHRLKAIGNGQVPLCCATAFRLLHERIGLAK
jgi:DNA (cytosine-5)-methyltransferase 1